MSDIRKSNMLKYALVNPLSERAVIRRYSGIFNAKRKRINIKTFFILAD